MAQDHCFRSQRGEVREVSEHSGVAWERTHGGWVGGCRSPQKLKTLDHSSLIRVEGKLFNEAQGWWG